MRRLAIALLGAAACLAVARADREAPAEAAPAPAAGGRRPRPAPVDVLQVSGLFDPIVVDAIEHGDRAQRRRRRPGAHPPGQHARRGRRPGPHPGADGATSRRRRCPSPSGSGRRAPACTGRPPSCSPSPTSPAWRRARGSATAGSRCARTATTVDFGAADEALRSGSLGLSDARSLGVFDQRVSDEGVPTIVNMVDALDGYEKDGVTLRTTERGDPRRRHAAAGTRSPPSASPSSASSTSCSTPSPARP